MRIQNNTKYSTADLRKFFNAGLTHMGADRDKWISVFYSKSRHVHGRACIGGSFGAGTWIEMWLPRGPHPLDLTSVARVFEHEVAHSLGVRHEDMDVDVRVCRQSVMWHEGLTIGVVEATKTKVDHVARREAHARRMLERWERKLKLAKTRFSKWSTKVRYYERRAAAAGRAGVKDLA